jgi:biotin carboxyl carrier protein
MQSSNGKRARIRWLLMLLAVATLSMPFIFWYQTWFGRALKDSQIDEYLADVEKPRNMQHAMSQVSERIHRRDPAAQRWYGRIIALSGHSSPEIRLTAAWVMGQDNQSQAFHDALLPLLEDSHAMVRRNAALALTRFADASGRSELVAALKPETVSAPASGTVRHKLEAGQEVGAGALLARIEQPGGGSIPVRAPFGSVIDTALVPDQTTVTENTPIVRINPGSEQVWEALRGLYLVGQSEDLDEVEAYRRQAAAAPAGIRRQATLTAQAIRMRAERTPIR